MKQPKKPRKPKANHLPKPKCLVSIVRTQGGEFLVGIAYKGNYAQESFPTLKEAESRVSDVLNGNKESSYSVAYWGINPEWERENA